MDIVDSNFRDRLDLMLKSVETADFIALDTEFSGLAVGFEDQVHAFDQVEDRYQKLKHNCSRMNAFQVGICCFKWDAKRLVYSSRPFNAYVFPHSEILGNKTLQFKASNIRFLMKHNFNFNKLFVEGVNYQRLSDEQLVRDKIEANLDSNPVVQPQNGSFGHINYNQQRSFTSIGSKSSKSLDDYIRKVQNFIIIANKSDECLVLDLNIESYALRRKLSQSLQLMYKDRNVILTQFQRRQPTFTVRKWREKESYEEIKAKEAAGLDTKQKEVKITEQDCISPIDSILDGNLHGLTVHYEDDKCLAASEKYSVSKTHFMVVSKDKSETSLQNASPDVIGHLMVVAAKVARQLDLADGYRVVMDQGKNGKYVNIPVGNLFLNVIGGQQLSWPPYNNVATEAPLVEESKAPQIQTMKKEEAQTEIYKSEMGLSLVIKAIIDHQKPLIGHNCMYDWLYVFNQFVSPLPPTYIEYIEMWSKFFPNTFDNKVLAFHSKSFYRTSLGEVYEKCISDDKFKNNLKFKFDVPNGFTNYEGTELHSHYHEAAYDAHMTGVAFAHTIKLKEIEEAKLNASGGGNKGGKGGAKGGNNSQEVKEAIQQLKNRAINIESRYPASLINLMMLDSFGSGRVYHFQPDQHKDYLAQITANAEFPETVYLQFEPNFINEMSAETVASMFVDYGDFYVYKDTENSCFFEFFYIDAAHVPDRSLDSFIKVVKDQKKLRVLFGCIHQKAPRFKAHDRVQEF